MYNTATSQTENNITYVFSLVENRQKYNFIIFLYLNNIPLTAIYTSMIAVVMLQTLRFLFFGGVYVCTAVSIYVT